MGRMRRKNSHSFLTVPEGLFFPPPEYQEKENGLAAQRIPEDDGPASSSGQGVEQSTSQH